MTCQCTNTQFTINQVAWTFSVIWYTFRKLTCIQILQNFWLTSGIRKRINYMHTKLHIIKYDHGHTNKGTPHNKYFIHRQQYISTEIDISLDPPICISSKESSGGIYNCLRVRTPLNALKPKPNLLLAHRYIYIYIYIIYIYIYIYIYICVCVCVCVCVISLFSYICN